MKVKNVCLWAQKCLLSLRISTICLDLLCVNVSHSLMDCKSTKCAGPDKSCNVQTGVCLHYCEVGYQGPMCNETCIEFTYGENCTQTCSPNCGEDKTCDPIDGHCKSGCIDGFEGDFCQDATRQIDPFNLAIIAAVFMTFLLLCVTAVMLGLENRAKTMVSRVTQGLSPSLFLSFGRSPQPKHIDIIARHQEQQMKTEFRKKMKFGSPVDEEYRAARKLKNFGIS